MTISTQKPTHAIRILVAGGAYAGVSFAINFLDLCQGRAARANYAAAATESSCAEEARKRGVVENVQVVIVDERDGYCMYFIFLFLIFLFLIY